MSFEIIKGNDEMEQMQADVDARREAAEVVAKKEEERTGKPVKPEQVGLTEEQKKALLKEKGHPNDAGSTVLNEAVAKRDHDIVAYYLTIASPGACNRYDKNELTPLCLALYQDDAKMVELLVAYSGVDLTKTANFEGMTYYDYFLNLTPFSSSAFNSYVTPVFFAYKYCDDELFYFFAKKQLETKYLSSHLAGDVHARYMKIHKQKVKK